jgi:mono/diheme cytochrome c family protein
MQLNQSIWFYLAIPLLWLSTPTFSATTQTTGPANKQSASTLYKEECASCHMAYPAELLPARSWKKILNSLDKHFGDNATLDPATLQTLSQYLQDNSADASDSRRGRKILRTITGDSTPLRITETPYIRRKHHEIPARYITGNPQVKSLSNCVACHQGAERSSYNEHDVRIPGYGRWDD